MKLSILIGSFSNSLQLIAQLKTFCRPNFLLLLLSGCILAAGPVQARSQITSNHSVNDQSVAGYLEKLARDAMVQSYLTTRPQSSTSAFGETDHDHCTPGNASDCIEAACSLMPSYKCDDIGELQQIANSCKGNYNGACLRASCKKLPSHQCDDIAEVTKMASSCKGNYGDACVNLTCSLMPSYKCDELTELSSIANFCQHVDANCIKAVCDRLPSYKCDDIDEIREVAAACS